LYACWFPFGAPGDVPPCILHLPFAIAGDWHGFPLGVLVPQRFARRVSKYKVPLLRGGAVVTGEDAIWHVVMDGEQYGPLSRTQILEYLNDERLIGNDLVWRPGFSDWKPISEVADFWQPPKRGVILPPPLPAPTERAHHENDQINPVATNRKWSIWKAVNVGLLVSALPLALQIANVAGSSLRALLRQPAPRPSCN
jgi:hypothetical protein